MFVRSLSDWPLLSDSGAVSPSIGRSRDSMVDKYTS